MFKWFRTIFQLGAPAVSDVDFRKLFQSILISLCMSTKLTLCLSLDSFLIIVFQFEPTLLKSSPLSFQVCAATKNYVYQLHISYQTFCCVVSLSILPVLPGLVKIQTTSKNTQRYYTKKHLIRDILSNTPNCYFGAGEFRGYFWSTNIA